MTTSSPRRTAASASRRRRRSPTSTRTSARSFENEEFDTVGGLVLQGVRPPAQARRGDDARRLPLPRAARRQPPAAHAAGRARRAAAGVRRRTRRRSASLPTDAALPRACAPRSRAALAGAATVFGFAPFGLALRCRCVTLALLFALWQTRRPRAQRPRPGSHSASGCSAPARRGSTSRSRRSAACRPRSRVLGTAGFVAYLALWPALAGYVARARRTRRRASRARSSPPARGRSPNGCAATSSPAFRGSPSATRSCRAAPLAGFAPIGGVFLVSLAVALVAALAGARVRRVAAARVPRASPSPPPASSRCSSVAARRRTDRMDGARGQAARRVARAGQRAAGR